MKSRRTSRRDFAKSVLAAGAAMSIGPTGAAQSAGPKAESAPCKPIAARKYSTDVLGGLAPGDTVYRTGSIVSATSEDGDVVLAATLIKLAPDLTDIAPAGQAFVRIRLLGDDVIRVMVSRTRLPFANESPMLEWDPTLRKRTAELASGGAEWNISAEGTVRARVGQEGMNLEFLPDGRVSLKLQAIDYFLKDLGQWYSLAAAFLVRANGTVATTLSLELRPGEHFCGTGERFTRMDLFGQQIDLFNVDAGGANTARAYKNIPFLMSSRPYGLFLHSSARIRIDVGRESTRSLQWVAEDETQDFFLIGGGSPERILWNYRRITGFPRLPPLWSFGAWMGRYSYRSADEMYRIADRLRNEKYPFDVLHLDPGWLKVDWECDWTFDETRFPDPPGFFQRLRSQGFRVSLWQYPYVTRTLPLADFALKMNYVGMPTDSSSGAPLGYTIDFTNPEAVAWYQGLLRRVLMMGASAIKADFGEDADEKALYANIDGQKIHNLYALLYQRSVWEVTEAVKHEPIIWARSGWAGSQRYPVHWGGDSHCSYDGLAGTLCGGLHFGLSGFGFWSHDIAGFVGVPDVWKDRPSDNLYVRWTQVGTFTSHMRFHGTSPREPWEFPAVSQIVREWLRFRYSLLPYLQAEAQVCCGSGWPMMRSLVMEWPDDPTAWGISDQYLLGSAFLVCPVLNDSGVRDVYLPEGWWVDFWSGKVLEGPLRLKGVKSALSRMPLFVRYDSRIEFAEPVQCTDHYAGARRFSIAFDLRYAGFELSELGALINI